MNYVLIIVFYLSVTAWLAYMAGDTIGSAQKGRKKIIKLAGKGKISLKEALKYCSQEQRKKFEKKRNSECIFMMLLALVIVTFLITMIKDFITWNTSLIIITTILEVIVVGIVFYLAYKFSVYYIKTDYSVVTIISHGSNYLIYSSDGKKIVNIIKITKQKDTDAKIEEIEPTKELLDLLDEETDGKKDYLMY